MRRVTSAYRRARVRRLVAILAAIALAAAVAGQGAGQTAFSPREEKPEDFPAGPGREETFYACVACHNFRLVAAQGMTRQQWSDSIDWMIQKPNMPPLDERERKVVLDYLERTFPPRAPARGGGWQNPFLPR
jgi:mono/diheme cytochrome c family protein